MEREAEERFVEGMLKESLVKGKRESVCTPSSSWRLFDLPQDGQNGKSGNHQLCRNVSSRKLGAELWETFPVCKMGGGLLNHTRSSQVPNYMIDGASGLMSEAAPSSVRLPHVTKHRNHFQQPTSSGSDISSAEAAPYSHYDSASSLGSSIKTRESSLTVGTSAEMAKALNHVLRLENQQASSNSHLKGLEMELYNSRERLNDLLRYKHDKQLKMEGAVEKGNFSRKCKSESLSTIEALKIELSDERRCRQHLESLNRKLAHDVAEGNLLFSSSAIKLEKERRSRKLLEELCDEFAKGILDSPSEMSSSKQYRSKETDLILHVAEAWLDKRIKTKKDANGFIKLSSLGFKTNGNLSSSQDDNNFYRRSSESFLLNKAVHQIPADEDNSTENELNSFEQHKMGTNRRKSGSSVGTDKAAGSKNSHHMVKDLIRKYSAGSVVVDCKTKMSDRNTLCSNPTQQLGSKLTKTPVNQKQHYLVRRSKERSLGSHLIQARKCQH
ncbi:unnamed protein product [Rhodiola kirilowii]